MQDMISMAIELHIGSIFLILLICGWVLFVLKSKESFRVLSKRYEMASLYYRIVLGALFFTGLVVMAVAKFDVSFMAYVMVLVMGHMTATSVKENIIYKKTHLKDIASQETFKKYALKKYTLDIIMIVVVGVVSYAVSL
jgi:hypothetical protein